MTSREERLQQRLRGAQTHQVRNADFGLAFPTAAPSTPSTRNEDANPDVSSQAGPSSAQANEQEQPKTPGLPSAKRGSGNSAGQSSSKRQRTEELLTLSTRSTRSQGRQTRDIYDIEEDEPEPRSTRSNRPRTPPTATQVVPTTSAADTTRTPNTKRKRDRPTEAVEEVSESPRGAPGSGQRRSVEQSSQQRREQVLSPQESPTVTKHVQAESPEPHSERRRPGRSRKSVPSRASPELGSEVTPQTARPRPSSEDIDELSPEQPEKTIISKPSQKFSDAEEEEEEEEEEEAEEIDDETAALKLSRTRRRRSTRHQEDELAEELSEEAEEKSDEEIETTPPSRSKQSNRKGRPGHGRPAISSPAVQSQPKTRPPGRQPRSATPSQSRPSQFSTTKPKSKPRRADPEKPLAKRRHRESVPVTVYRFTKPIVYDESATDADILNSEIPYAKRSGVNPVDVLAQITEEVIDSALNALEEGGRNAEAPVLRREFRTRMRAVEAFQEGLRVRLLELTIGLDNVHSLRKRIRDAQRERVELRDEIIRIRKEREDIALRMDEVRRKHESGAQMAEKRDQLNSTVHDIELAVERGKAQDDDEDGDMVGLELLLKKVASKASSKSEEGGMLKQIREFNAFLERAAVALENRG